MSNAAARSWKSEHSRWSACRMNVQAARYKLCNVTGGLSAYGVGVEQDHAVPLLLQRLAGLGA